MSQSKTFFNFLCIFLILTDLIFLLFRSQQKKHNQKKLVNYAKNTVFCAGDLINWYFVSKYIIQINNLNLLWHHSNSDCSKLYLWLNQENKNNITVLKVCYKLRPGFLTVKNI